MTADLELVIGAIDDPDQVIATAASYGLHAEAVPTARGRRVLTTGADGRPAWLDTLMDARYLAAELTWSPPPPAPEPTPAPWARAHPCCACCGTTARKHRARGLCTTCWDRHLNRGARTDRNADRLHRPPPRPARELERTAA